MALDLEIKRCLALCMLLVGLNHSMQTNLTEFWLCAIGNL
ncbi:unnamed protein product [Acidithrix sp. C25]|nr:unnamed protein product [Acidithrix sp. C25]